MSGLPREGQAGEGGWQEQCGRHALQGGADEARRRIGAMGRGSGRQALSLILPAPGAAPSSPAGRGLSPAAATEICCPQNLMNQGTKTTHQLVGDLPQRLLLHQQAVGQHQALQRRQACRQWAAQVATAWR